MGFFDWIRNKGWNQPSFGPTIRLSKRSSDRAIADAIEKLLDEQLAHEARDALEPFAHRAQPLLEAAVSDHRFRTATYWPERTASTPFELVLELLEIAGSPTPKREAERLYDHKDWQFRRAAATYLAKAPEARHKDAIIQLLLDDEHLVSDKVQYQLRELPTAATPPPAVRDALYPILKRWALRTDRGQSPDAGVIMLRIDRDRAIADLTAPSALDVRLNWLDRNLDALRELKISIPQATLLKLLDDAARSYDAELDTTNHSHWAWQMKAVVAYLETTDFHGLEDLLVKLSEHPNESLRVQAAETLVKRSGVDPLESTYTALDRVGFDRLNPVQQNYLAVWEIDAEVRNGGFLQYFSNSYGAHVYVALRALNAMNAHAAARIVEEAIAAFGAGGVPADRNQRNDVLSTLIPTDQSPFDALDGRWYADEDHLLVRLARYAMEHRTQFV